VLPDSTEVQVDVASSESRDVVPGTPVTVALAERPVLVAPAEPDAETSAVRGGEPDTG
jgi:hypothetical protein